MYRIFTLLLAIAFALAGTTTSAVGQDLKERRSVGMLPLGDVPADVRKAAQEAVQGPDGEGKDGPMAKVGLELALVYYQDERSGPAGVKSLRTADQAPPERRAVSPLSKDGRSVVVDAIASGQSGRLMSDLRALGLEGGARAGAVVSGRLPVSAIKEAASLSSLRGLLPSYARTQVGSVDSEADATHGAVTARDRFGVDGSGEKICVLSNSYDQDDDAGTSASEDIASGDLPGEGNPEGRTTPVDVLDDSQGGDDEGRAMLQLVHDIAPGAELGFHTGFGGLANFAQGIRELADAGCTVIADDVLLFIEPFYQDGPVSLAIDDVVNNDAAAYFASAGNSGQDSYEAQFRSSGQSGVLSDNSEAHDFDPDGSSTDIRQKMEIDVGNKVTITSLQWTDPAALSDASSEGPDTDIDIALVDQNDNIVSSNQRDNIAQGYPYEAMEFENDGSIDADGDGTPDSTFAFVIEKFDGPAPDEVKYVYDGGVQIKEFDTLGPTVFGHSQAEGASTIAAAPFFDNDTLEPFSSKGGIDIRFDAQGNELDSPESRDKPDLTGVDAVSNTFFGSDATGDGTPNFFGTSAAMPNVAAVAGLLREAEPAFTPQEVYNRLEATARDITQRKTRGGGLESIPSGVDDWSGHGLVQAAEAIVTSFPPRITSLRPRSGAPGARVGIYGAYFSPNSLENVVAFGDVEEEVLFASWTKLTKNVPSGPSGPVKLTVTRSDTTATAPELFTVLTGGTDTFGRVGTGMTPVGLGEAEWGDFDGDADLDLVVVGQEAGFEETATIYENKGGGEFSPVDSGPGGADEGSADWGDFDADGDLDLVVTGDDANLGETLSARIYENLGGGTFADIEAGLVGVASGSSDWGDFDGDGDLDLVITGYDENFGASARLYVNVDEGGFQPIVDPLGDALEAVDNSDIARGDFDGDGDQDLVIVGLDKDDNPSTTVYQNQGGGEFSVLETNLPDVDGSVDWGNLNESGTHLDLVLTGLQTGKISAKIYSYEGEGEFAAVEAGLTGVSRGTTADWGDFDGDEDVDLLLTGLDPGALPSATIYEKKGDGEDLEFVPIEAGLTGVNHGLAEWGDYDGDGDLDLFISGLTGGGGSETLALYENGLIASASQTVAGDDTTAFGGTGVTIRFSGTSGSGEVTVEKQDGGPSGTDGISESNVSEFRYLISAGGDLSFDSDTEVRLDVGTLSGVEAPEDVLIYTRSTEGGGSFSELPTSYDAEANQLVATTGSFSEFALASETNSLPVELANVEATRIEEGAVLTWQTASETNNAGFEVQRRTSESATWEQIGYVKSKAQGGTTTETKSYSYTAEDLPVGTHQFRLKQINLDGSSTLTDPVSVRVKMQEAVKLTPPAPNPASSSATLSFAVKEQAETTITLYNTLGQRVATVYEGTPQAGEQQAVQIDVSGLPSGTYFLRLRAEDKTATRRVTVVR